MNELQGANTAKRAGTCTFYCRWRNRVVRTCARDGGPQVCPLRRECPADTLLESFPASARLLNS